MEDFITKQEGNLFMALERLLHNSVVKLDIQKNLL